MTSFHQELEPCEPGRDQKSFDAVASSLSGHGTSAFRSARQILTVLSDDALTIVFPSGENATSSTLPLVGRQALCAMGGTVFM